MLSAAVLLSSAILPAADQDCCLAERQDMIRRIREIAAQVAHDTGQPQPAREVLAALGRVARHEFVPAEYRDLAYQDRPLPIGYDQTISQPYIVALMSDLARIETDARVLEVGTGSGYQAAVLAELGAEVYTVEIVEGLGRRAERLLQRLGYDRVMVAVGDGYEGWEEHAPYDAILVTATSPEVPPMLLEQLKPGGRLVMPIGSAGDAQVLSVLEKTEDGQVRRRNVLPVRFVPLTGPHTEP